MWHNIVSLQEIELKIVSIYQYELTLIFLLWVSCQFLQNWLFPICQRLNPHIVHHTHSSDLAASFFDISVLTLSYSYSYTCNYIPQVWCYIESTSLLTTNNDECLFGNLSFMIPEGCTITLSIELSHKDQIPFKARNVSHSL